MRQNAAPMTNVIDVADRSVIRFHKVDPLRTTFQFSIFAHSPIERLRLPRTGPARWKSRKSRRGAKPAPVPVTLWPGGPACALERTHARCGQIVKTETWSGGAAGELRRCRRVHYCCRNVRGSRPDRVTVARRGIGASAANPIERKEVSDATP